MLKRNIQLSYLITFFLGLAFWWPIWVLFYLRFTDYSGVAMLETTWVISVALFEIPTGAVADMLGKKKSLFLGTFVLLISNVFMVLAADLTHVFLSMPFYALGLALNSGSFEALIYDSLKQEGKEGKFSNVIANKKSVNLIAIAIGAILGAMLFKLDPRMPFAASAIMRGIALISVLLLIEPIIDTEKFNFANYVKQTKAGFGNLLKVNFRGTFFVLLVVMTIGMISFEFLDDILLVDYGYDEKVLGYLFAAISVVSAAVSRFSAKLSKVLGAFGGFLFVSFLFGVSYLFSPFIGMVALGAMMFVRNSLYSIQDNLVQEILNKNTVSAERATTISTFSMMKTFFYGLSGVGSSYLMSLVLPSEYAFGLGILLTVFLLAVLLRASLVNLGYGRQKRKILVN